MCAKQVDAAGLEVALSQIDLANVTYDNSGNSTGSSYTYAGTHLFTLMPGSVCTTLESLASSNITLI